MPDRLRMPLTVALVGLLAATATGAQETGAQSPGPGAAGAAAAEAATEAATALASAAAEETSAGEMSAEEAAAAEAAAAQAAAERERAALEALELRGATIGAINIQIDNVFNTADPAEDKRLYRWANNVHITTRPSVVEEVLLFESGDAISAQLIAESERLLRDRRYVADATITPGAYDPATNTAAVNVWMRDAWSLEPDIKLSRTGGENEFGLGLSEDNMFGRGKSMTLSYESNVDRDIRFFGYRDPNLFGSRKQLNATIVDMSDGHQYAFSTGRPFYSLDTRWSVWTDLIDDERVDFIYDLGEVIDEFRHETRYLSVAGGRSRGLIDGVALRWLAGLNFEEDLFEPNPGFGPPLLLPEDRRLVYPWGGFQWIGDDWREVSDLNDMGRIEDLSLGLNLTVRLGLATPKLDADRRATIFNFRADRGWEPGGDGNLALLSARAETREESGDLVNTIVSLSGRYMHRNFGDELFLVSLQTVFGNHLDAENQVVLGGDTNLRGYPLRYQTGERSVLLNVEQRFYTDFYAFRLIRIGYAFFLDAGRVTGNDPRMTPNLGTLYNLGMGLRLTSPRSSSNSVVHVDLAFPINAPSDIDSVQFIIERKATF